jgi:hypothetical protein
MTCPRCKSPDTELIMHSSVVGTWDIHLCHTCFYSWRTSEPASVLNAELYDARFRLTPEKIARFSEFPLVPAAFRKMTRR